MLKYKNIIKEIGELESFLLPRLAELGSVAFVATAIFAAIAAAAEFLQPGFVVNYVSPRAVVAVAVLSGGLALTGKRSPGTRSRRQRLSYAAFGLLAAVLTFWTAWYYFQSVPAMRTKLSLAAALTVAAAFWLMGRPQDGSAADKKP